MVSSRIPAQMGRLICQTTGPASSTRVQVRPSPAFKGIGRYPGVQASSSDEASGTWIGIDGDGVSSLIQAGTAQNSGPDFGGTQYYAWVQLLPGAPEIIGGPSGPAPVSPGDMMAASIFESSPGLWTIDLNDTTQNWSLSQQFPYSHPGQYSGMD